MLGVFDSGYGGLSILRALCAAFPQYDFCYFGDNARAPYGPRSAEEIYQFTKEGVEFLEKQGCTLIILACNTASAVALRRLQQERGFAGARVLGVLVPSLESIVAAHPKRVAIVGTEATVRSHAFVRELEKMDSNIVVMQQPIPELAGMIERKASREDVRAVILAALSKFPQSFHALVLGCTHYGHVADIFAELVTDVTILHQDVAVVTALRDYLLRHPEIEVLLGREGNRKFFSSSLLSSSLEEGYSFFFGSTISVVSTYAL